MLPSPVAPAVRDPRKMMRPGLEDMAGQDPRSMENTGGFDASDLMARPEMRQAETRNQAAMVSDPYREANMMAAEKTNPMNAASQEPGKSFLMKFIGK